MILPIYLIKKFIRALLICTGLSYSIFFIFSLIGNLDEKFSFNSIFYLSILNSFQIFTYIPSHLYVLSFCLLIIDLKSKNELTIIKEYIELKNLFLIIIPILIIFIFIESNKDVFSSNIENIKSNLINSNKVQDTKILISSEGDIKKYFIFSGYDGNNATVDQYLRFETKKQTIYEGEISKKLNVHENNLLSYESTIYENDDFQHEVFTKKLYENFLSFWSKNNLIIIKSDNKGINSKYKIIHSIGFNVLFYFCISMIFFSKRLVDRGTNTKKVFLLVTLIFLYFLLIPKIMLNNFQYSFQFISIMIFILIFIKIKQYE